MSAYDELHFLAEEEVRLSAQLAEMQAKEIELAADVQDAREAFEKAQKTLAILEQNFRTMKDAPIVHIRRYKEVVDAIARHRHAASHFSGEERRLSARLLDFQHAVEEAEDRLEEVFRRRAEYGRIIPFRHPDNRRGS